MSSKTWEMPDGIYTALVTPFKDGEVAPGITAIPCHGHTPGHTAFLIESAGESSLETDALELVGDHFRRVGIELWTRTSQRVPAPRRGEHRAVRPRPAWPRPG